MSTKKKILTVCNGGNCRSPMLAEVFKGTHGCEAISAGTYWLSQETMKMLADWADLICPVEPFEAKLPERDLGFWKASIIWTPAYAHKLRVAAVGPDIWGHSNATEMKLVCHMAAREILG